MLSSTQHDSDPLIRNLIRFNVRIAFFFIGTLTSWDRFLFLLLVTKSHSSVILGIAGAFNSLRISSLFVLHRLSLFVILFIFIIITWKDACYLLPSFLQDIGLLLLISLARSSVLSGFFNFLLILLSSLLIASLILLLLGVYVVQDLADDELLQLRDENFGELARVDMSKEVIGSNLPSLAFKEHLDDL